MNYCMRVWGFMRGFDISEQLISAQKYLTSFDNCTCQINNKVCYNYNYIYD